MIWFQMELRFPQSEHLRIIFTQNVSSTSIGITHTAVKLSMHQQLEHEINEMFIL